MAAKINLKPHESQANVKLLYIRALNKQKIVLTLEKFFELIQSIVDIGNLFYCSLLFCLDEPNLIVGKFNNNVRLDRDTNLSSTICYYVVRFIAVGKLLIHSWLFVRIEL